MELQRINRADPALAKLLVALGDVVVHTVRRWLGTLPSVLTLVAVS